MSTRTNTETTGKSRWDWLSGASATEAALLVFVDGLKYWLVALVLYLIGAGLGFVPWFWEAFGILDTRVVKVSLVGIVVAVIGVGWLAIWGVKKIWDPRRMYIIRINLTKEQPIKVKIGHPSEWDDVDVISGSPLDFSLGGYRAKLVTDFRHVGSVSEGDDLWTHVPRDDAGNPLVDGYIATGSWLGEASDAEIAQSRHQIEANRRRNNLWARLGEKMTAKIGKIADDVERRHHHKLEQKKRDLTLYEDTVSEALRDEIEEYEEIEEDKTPSEIIEDEISRQMEQLNQDSGVLPQGGEQ